MRDRRDAFGYMSVGLLVIALLSSVIVPPAAGSGKSRKPSKPSQLLTSEAPGPNSPASAAKQNTATALFSKAPLSFEANQGQFDQSVKYIARGPGYQLFLTPTGAALSLHRNTEVTTDKKDFGSNTTTVGASDGDIVRMKLLGARSNARISGEEVLPGKVNYMVGNDRRGWRTNVSTYGKVRYTEIYEGIDVVYYGSQRQLEYDFHVAPGADPGSIRLGFEGVERTELDSVTGDLILRLSGGDVIRQHKPVLYQEEQGGRRPIPGSFVLLGNDQVGFEVGAYDRNRALVIDPVLEYSTYFGGSGEEGTAGIVVDSAGSAYVTGVFITSPGFPVSPNAFQKTQNNTNGNGEVFVTKFTPDGSSIVYSTLLGGSSTDSSTGIGLDAAGNAYVVGWTVSSDFPVRNAFQSTLRGFPNAFLTKLNATGSDLLYSSYLGGSGNFDFGTDVAVDSTGNAYITGDTGSVNFPVTPGAFRTTHVRLLEFTGDQDGFVAKFNTNASGAASLVYSTFFNIHASFSNAIAIDAAGNAYVAGRVGQQARVEKLNPAGSALVYSFTIPNSQPNPGFGLSTTDIAVDSTGQAYVTGFTDSFGLTIVNGFQPNYGGGSIDGFMVKLNAAGTSLLYSTYIGGADMDVASAVAVDSAGHAYVVGDTASLDFPTRDAFQNLKLGFGSDVFVSRVNTNATGADSLVFSTYYGATGFDEAGAGIAIDAEGNIYVTGFPFRTIFTGIIHTGKELTIQGAAIPGDELQFDPFILKIANTSPTTLRFGAEELTVSEGAGSLEVTVVRGGDTSGAVNVDFATLDGGADSRSDFTAAYGTLRFAPGETSKTFRVLIMDDSRSEVEETFYVILREHMPGVALAAPTVAELKITDNDPFDASINPIDIREFFVRQHYLDFLNREPDTEGFQFWIGQISAACDGQPSEPGCVDQRVNVSGAFFLSTEFSETGFFVYRLHKASFGSLPRFTPFLRDTQEVGRDVVVNRTGWEELLEQNKQRLIAEWVERTDFKSRYDALTNEQYVDALNANTGNALTTTERDALVAGLNAATLTRGQALRAVAENEEFKRKESSPAFVLLQYFGYLRRDPDPNGYQFWLNKLNEFDGDFRRAEMVEAFITSGEYRARFGLD